MKHLKTYLLIAVVAAVPLVALAASQQNCDSAVGFCNPLASNSLCGAMKDFLQAVMNILAPVLVVLFVLAGARFVFARGNAEKLIVARRNMLYVVIGTALFLGAWLIGQIAANTVAKLSGNSASGGSFFGSCN